MQKSQIEMSEKGFFLDSPVDTWRYKAWETVTCVADHTYDPRVIGTYEFSLAGGENTLFSTRKSICFHGDAVLPCPISSAAFYG